MSTSACASPRSSVRPSASSACAEGGALLVVDPQAAARRHVAAVARGLGLTVVETGDAARARELLGPDVRAVVVEPLAAGPAAPAWLRALVEAEPRRPVIVHTADTRPQAVAAWLRTGAVDVLAKPAREERLAGALRRHALGVGA